MSSDLVERLEALIAVFRNQDKSTNHRGPNCYARRAALMQECLDELTRLRAQVAASAAVSDDYAALAANVREHLRFRQMSVPRVPSDHELRAWAEAFEKLAAPIPSQAGEVKS